MQSDLLDIVIGVVFVWFVLSSVLSGINAGFSQLTHLKAKHLWLGVARLVNPKTSPLPRRFWDATWNIPLRGRGDLRPKAADTDGQAKPVVEGIATAMSGRPARKEPRPDIRPLVQDVYDQLSGQVAEPAAPGRLSKVKSLSAESVADALLRVARSATFADDLTAAASAAAWSSEEIERLELGIGGLEPAAVEDGRSRPLTKPEVVGFATAQDLSSERLADLYDAAARDLSPADVVRFFEGNPRLADALRDTVARVGGTAQAQAIRTTLETWFDREMTNISETYRRQNRKILGLLAAVLVLVLQSNAVTLVRDLRSDGNLRTALTSAATTAAAEDSVEAVVDNVYCTTTTSSSSSTTSTTTTAAAEGTSTTSTTVGPQQQLQAALDELSCAGDIIGRASKFRAGLAWEEFREAHGGTGDEADGQWADVWPYLHEDWAIPGRLLTWAALLLGAPFWFDVMKRLIGLRGASSSAGDRRSP